MDGMLTTLVNPIELKDCDVDYPDNNPSSLLPSLRGLAVDEDGTVFAAGVGCRALVKISPDGRKVETVLKAERPWSPTGVAVHQGEVYILEYTNANGSPNEGWRPRVRKLGRDGKVTTLVAAAPEPDKPERKYPVVSFTRLSPEFRFVWQGRSPRLPPCPRSPNS